MITTTGQFQEGDVVQLNSGGPKMTVTEVRGSNYFCMWFTSDSKLQNAIFNVDTLRSYVPKQSQPMPLLEPLPL